jgi:hypothetical protein
MTLTQALSIVPCCQCYNKDNVIHHCDAYMYACACEMCLSSLSVTMYVRICLTQISVCIMPRPSRLCRIPEETIRALTTWSECKAFSLGSELCEQHNSDHKHSHELATAVQLPGHDTGTLVVLEYSIRSLFRHASVPRPGRMHAMRSWPILLAVPSGPHVVAGTWLRLSQYDSKALFCSVAS